MVTAVGHPAKKELWQRGIGVRGLVFFLFHAFLPPPYSPVFGSGEEKKQDVFRRHLNLDLCFNAAFFIVKVSISGRAEI